MNENCAAMPPTTNDRESSKSPSGNHSIDDILGIKVAAASHLGTAQQQAMYSGSDSSSDSSSNSTSERETSPSFPVEHSTPASTRHHQQLLQMATLAGAVQQGQGQQQQQGEEKCFIFIPLHTHDVMLVFFLFLQNKQFYKYPILKVPHCLANPFKN